MSYSDQEVTNSSARPGGESPTKREPRAGIGIIVALGPDNRLGSERESGGLPACMLAGMRNYDASTQVRMMQHLVCRWFRLEGKS